MSFENEHLTRQLDIVPMAILSEPITIVGAGAIGGWATLSLAKMGFKFIRVIDFDKVDTVNMNAQFYRFKDIGKFKVDALKELVEDFTGTVISTSTEAYRTEVFNGVVISAVDSMAVRKLVWENHVKNPYATRIIIDPRMGAQQALLYAMKPMDERDKEAYSASLYDDRDAVQERCTNKATIWTANLLSGLVVKSVVDILTKPNYLRTAQWDIAKDSLLAFQKE